MYGEWFTKATIVCGMIVGKLNKCQFDILRLLAENGSRSVYDLAKMTGFDYSYLHRNTIKLKEMELVEFQTDISGKHLRKLFDLNFRGMIVFLIAWEDYTEETKKSIEAAIIKNPQFFPFSNQLNEIEEIVGKELLFKELTHTAGYMANGKNIKIQIDHLKLEFSAFFYQFIEPGRFLPNTDFKGMERNKKFAEFLASQEELKKAYISFLAIQDIIDLEEDRLRIYELAKFRSERELAFFEKRDLSTDSLFPKQRLREIFPKYAEMKYVFAGSLMTRLLWKKSEKPVFEEKKGFHVYFPY